MKRFISLSFLMCLMISHLFAQSEKYSRVRIWTDESGLVKLSGLGIETDHGDIRRGVWLTSDFSASEILRIQQAGFRTEILIDDVQQYYASQSGTSQTRIQAGGNCSTSSPDYPVPANFNLGSMGGYFTYQQMLDNLDSMASKYPNLITIRADIPGGTTIENRPIYWVKISDNPAVDESEPEMLYTAVHHAREPGGMSQLIYYMWYLLENYASGGDIGTLVDNTEMYFIPCINPDGYIFNETNYPSGGGMWRKNRRDNQDGTFGVDLNRNYGYNWGFDDFGSSPDGFDETYRGSTPFSEPETQLVSSFVNSRNFSMALNYHTYGNLLIYPWGYDYSIYTPDSALFTDFGKMLTEYNSYTYGTADQTVGYIVNGSSDDWMYGEQTVKPKVFAMTPETGDAGFGFWPPSNEIIPICQLNMYQNILAAQLCGRYASLEENTPELISQGGGFVKYDFKQLGLDTTGTYTVSLTAVTSNIIQTGNPKSYSNLLQGQSFTDSISFALTTPMSNGDPVTFLLILDNGLFTVTDTVKMYFGSPVIAFASNCNSSTGWSIGQWGISTSTYYSPSASIADSPSGNYASNDFKSVTISSPIDLTTAVKANLTFYAKWALEANYDFVQVRASTDNGNSWTPLCGKYTVPGSLWQDPDAPLYDGFQLTWVKEEMSLDDYLGQNILISFLLVSDGWMEYDGFFFDDILVEKVLPGTNSINEISTEMQLTVSPNPAGNYTYINFSTPVPQHTDVRVTDISGREIFTESINAGVSSALITTDNLSSGIYFIQTVTEGRMSAPVRLAVQ